MTPTPRQIKALRTLAIRQAEHEAAGRKFDAAFATAVRLGCTQADLARELDVTRQAVNQRIKSLFGPSIAATMDGATLFD